MARVRAKEVFYDNIAIRQPGEEFDYDGAPGKAIEFLNPADEQAAREKMVRAQLERKLRAEAENQAAVEALERDAKLHAELEHKIRAEIIAELEAKQKGVA